MLARNKACLAHSYLIANRTRPRRINSSNSNNTILMKALATLALVASILGLTSCKSCPLAPKKECCHKDASCCDGKKSADCKTCKH